MNEPYSDDRLAVALDELNRALMRLEEALARSASSDTLVRDATIQRFEFCFELAWKALKFALLTSEGFDTVSPKATLQKAYAVQWINNEKQWIDMLTDRNLSSHTYREQLAQEIYSRIGSHAKSIRELYLFLIAKFEK